MGQNGSDAFAKDRWGSARSAVADLRSVARAWNHPLELVQQLKLLMTQRPLLALGVAVALGAVLHGRLVRRTVI